jgi:hypothetical protein
MDKSFTVEDYYAWVKDKIAQNGTVNVRTVEFGPKDFNLLYFARKEFDWSDHEVVYSVKSSDQFQSFM